LKFAIADKYLRTFWKLPTATQSNNVLLPAAGRSQPRTMMCYIQHAGMGGIEPNGVSVIYRIVSKACQSNGRGSGTRQILTWPALSAPTEMSPLYFYISANSAFSCTSKLAAFIFVATPPCNQLAV